MANRYSTLGRGPDQIREYLDNYAKHNPAHSGRHSYKALNAAGTPENVKECIASAKRGQHNGGHVPKKNDVVAACKANPGGAAP